MINVCNSLRLLSNGFICDELVKDCNTFMDNTLHNFMSQMIIMNYLDINI